MLYRSDFRTIYVKLSTCIHIGSADKAPTFKTSTKVPSLSVCFCRLVTHCQRRFVLRFLAFYNYVYACMRTIHCMFCTPILENENVVLLLLP